MKYWLVVCCFLYVAAYMGGPVSAKGILTMGDQENGVDGPFERSVDSFGEVEDAHCGFFIKHAEKSLFGFNTKRVNNVALAECWKLCTKERNFYCRSVDFNADSSNNGDSTTCFLSSENSQTQPEALDNNFNTDYYERECEAPVGEGSAVGGSITI